MDDYDPDDYVDQYAYRRSGVNAILAILGVIAIGTVVGLVFLGGQVTAILSDVGNPIGREPGSGETTAVDNGQEAPPDDGVTDITGPDGKGGQVADAEAKAPEMLIIRTGQLEVEVADIEAAVAGARSRVISIGGYVSSSDEQAGDDATAIVTFRMPAERWDDALAAVRGVGDATRHLQVQTQAVTGQVIDLGARITNLRATESALQAIMAQATTIPDVLEVQGKLTEVRGEIERLSAEKAHLEEQAAYGTLTVTFALPVAPIVEEVKAGWDPATDADAATGTLISMGQHVASLGIWFAIVGLPILLVIVVGVAFAVFAWKMLRRMAPSPDPS